VSRRPEPGGQHTIRGAGPRRLRKSDWGARRDRIRLATAEAHRHSLARSSPPTSPRTSDAALVERGDRWSAGYPCCRRHVYRWRVPGRDAVCSLRSAPPADSRARFERPWDEKACVRAALPSPHTYGRLRLARHSVPSQGGLGILEAWMAVVPLAAGAASMVLTSDGHLSVRAWPGGVPQAGVAAVRQNLSLLIDHGGRPDCDGARHQQGLDQLHHL
jgi:hypothetical protein